ncbi:MAG: hypothetical protein Q9165_002800 [Trypethelium subeluteriae]
MPQDMPPTGGYEPVQYKRNLPARGFRASYYLIGVGLIMTYGFYRLGIGIRERKYDHLLVPKQGGERDEIRISTNDAEEDRDQVRRYLADKAREKELLGSETKVYNSDRYVLNLGI